MQAVENYDVLEILKEIAVLDLIPISSIEFVLFEGLEYKNEMKITNDKTN